MNILFMSMAKLRNINSNSLYTDLLRKFRDSGHNVFVMTPIEKKYNLPTVIEYDEGVTFLRVKTGNLQNVNFIEKGVSTLTIENLYLKALKKHFKEVKFDLVLYSTPPITLTKVIKYIKNRDNAKTYLLLKDIFPQNAVDINLFKSNGIIDKFFRRKEKQLYSVSDYIGCMSPANVSYILNSNPEILDGKVEVNPNTIEPRKLNISNNLKKKIREKYNVPYNKSIFIYGGNLGKPQGIDFLIKCIKKNEENTESYILIVGSGSEFNKLNDYLKNNKPNNTKLLKHLPK